MDRTEFRDALYALDPDDREGLVTAVQERVRALSQRHLDIQERIESNEQSRQDLHARLQAAERAIVEQADASVDAEIDSIDDVESLPPDADVEFDPELLAEVQQIREQARSNYQDTADEGSDLQAELARNGEELQLHKSVLTDLEEGDLTTAEAREHLLAFFEEGEEGAVGDDSGADPEVADDDGPAATDTDDGPAASDDGGDE